MIDLTVVVGLDVKTLEQWALSLRTIEKNRRELFEFPWVIFYDYEQITSQEISSVFQGSTLSWIERVRLVPWPYEDCQDKYPSQRGKMLSGFVHAPAREVKTKWWMKIDTDVCAIGSKNEWIQDEWFEDDVVLVASRWGYTKAKGDNRTIEEWCDALEEWGDDTGGGSSRLNLKQYVRNGKLIKSRFWSPVSFYRTDWCRVVANKCNEYCGPCQLPVPSQDSVHWYATQRWGAKYRTIQMKSHGWRFCSKTKWLAEAVGEICRQEGI